MRDVESSPTPSPEVLAGTFGHHDEHLDDVFDTYRRFRTECPVGRSDLYGGFWFLSRYDDIYRAEQSVEDYSVQPSMLLPPVGQRRPLIPLDIDPPMLQKYRRIMLPAFAPKEIDRFEPTVRRVAVDLLDRIGDGDTFDASLEYARPFPMTVFAIMAGLPLEDLDRFNEWVERLFYVRTRDFSETERAAAEVCDYFAETWRRRLREPPREDLIGRLLSAEIDGKPLTEEEFIDYAFLLAAAGLETTAWAVRAAIWHLAQHPEDRRRLAADPSLMAVATEEFLRCLAPVQGMARTLKNDVEVRGRRLEAGQRVLLLFGSGNRDESVFPDPDAIKIDRLDNPHFAFGVGVHRCLGSNLGRREVRVALEELLKRFPDFHVAPDVEPVWHGVGPLPIVVER